MKRRVAEYSGGCARGNPRHIGRIAEACTPCPSWMWGNPRRYFNEPSLKNAVYEAGSRRQLVP